MNKIHAAFLSLLFASALVQAEGLVDGDAEAGKAKAITCGACHGQDGNSVNPVWPSLAGQHATYLVEQLQAFKAGTRSDPLMLGQVMMLNEDDMRTWPSISQACPRPPSPLPTRQRSISASGCTAEATVRTTHRRLHRLPWPDRPG